MKEVRAKRAGIYARVSTDGQTTDNQIRELRQVAERNGWQIVQEYVDHGISGAKGREQRPAFDALWKGTTRREFDVVMVWAVDRLGRFRADTVAGGVRIDLRSLTSVAVGVEHQWRSGDRQLTRVTVDLVQHF